MLMSASHLSEYEINATLMDVVSALYDHGITEVNLGGLMRLMGMPNTEASAYDDELLEITAALAVYSRELARYDTTGQTIH